MAHRLLEKGVFTAHNGGPLRHYKKYSLFFVAAMIFFNVEAMAFKIDTHIWIADHIYRQIKSHPENMVKLNVDGKTPLFIPLSSRVKDAILKHPEYFRMGSIGPDAFPDVLAGQMAIHPGTKSQGTAHWLHDLFQLSKNSTPKEVAFIYGFHVHVATDVFAHTYVNELSGGVFDVVKKPDITERHILLESYISNFTPKFPQGDIRELLTDPETNKLAIPVDFIKNAFYDNKEIAGRFKFSGAKHVSSIFKMKKELRYLVSEDGPVNKIENDIARYIVYEETGIDLSRDEMNKLRNAAEKLHKEVDVVDDVIRVAGDIARHNRGLNRETRKIVTQAFNDVENGLDELKGLIDEKNDLKRKINNKKHEIEGIVPKKLSQAHIRHCNDKYNLCKIAHPVDPSKKCKKKRKACKSVAPLIDNPPHIALEKEINRLTEELDNTVYENIKRSIANTQRNVDDFIGLIQEITDARIKANDILKELYQDYQPGRKSPIRDFVYAWIKNMDRALTGLIIANGETIVNSVTVEEGALKPMTDWVSCQSWAFVGVPTVITNTMSCDNPIEDIKAQHDKLVDGIIKSDPVSGEHVSRTRLRFKKRIDQLKKKLTEDLTKEGVKVVSQLSNIDILYWKSLFTDKVTPEKLTKAFQAPSPRQSAQCEDIVLKIENDMHLSGGALSPSKFSPVHDAIQLSGLALLSQRMLSKLVKYIGIKETIYGPSMYSLFSTSWMSRNILYGFAKNIDGNHQWLNLAPAFVEYGVPREGEYMTRFDDKRYRFGYGYLEKESGLRIYADPVARESLFKKIFKGNYIHEEENLLNHN